MEVQAGPTAASQASGGSGLGGCGSTALASPACAVPVSAEELTKDALAMRTLCKNAACESVCQQIERVEKVGQGTPHPDQRRRLRCPRGAQPTRAHAAGVIEFHCGAGKASDSEKHCAGACACAHKLHRYPAVAHNHHSASVTQAVSQHADTVRVAQSDDSVRCAASSLLRQCARSCTHCYAQPVVGQLCDTVVAVADEEQLRRGGESSRQHGCRLCAPSVARPRL
jgi:hypothetical protein